RDRRKPAILPPGSPTMILNGLSLLLLRLRAPGTLSYGAFRQTSARGGMGITLRASAMSPRMMPSSSRHYPRRATMSPAASRVAALPPSTTQEATSSNERGAYRRRLPHRDRPRARWGDRGCRMAWHSDLYSARS